MTLTAGLHLLLSPVGPWERSAVVDGKESEGEGIFIKVQASSETENRGDWGGSCQSWGG